MEEREKEEEKERARQRKRTETQQCSDSDQRNATAVSEGQRALVSLVSFLFFFTYGPNAAFNMLAFPHDWWFTSKPN